MLMLCAVAAFTLKSLKKYRVCQQATTTCNITKSGIVLIYQNVVASCTILELATKTAMEEWLHKQNSEKTRRKLGPFIKKTKKLESKSFLCQSGFGTCTLQFARQQKTSKDVFAAFVQIEARELQAEAERMEREMELEKTREAERQKKLDEAAAKQRAREKEIEEREVSTPVTQSVLQALSIFRLFSQDLSA